MSTAGIRASVADELVTYGLSLDIHKRNHLGYPFCLKYDHAEQLAETIQDQRYTLINIGDPFSSPIYQISSLEYERQVLGFFAELFGLDRQPRPWWGYIGSCGTEGNLYGLLLGRLAQPEGILYFSEAAHYSVGKAARMFRMPYRKVRSQASGEMDYAHLAEIVESGQPVIINLTLGTTFTGAVDEIGRTVEALTGRGIGLDQVYIHVDAALGGMIACYIRPELISFDWPIGSLAISGHKFIGCPHPCGVVLTYKETADRFSSEISAEVEYIGSTDLTIMGSRNGHTPLYLWAEIQRRKSTFHLEAEAIVDKARFLHQKLSDQGLPALLNPLSSTVVFPRPPQPVIAKYQLAVQVDQAHAVIMQQHSYELLEEFAGVLGTCLG
ncbi:histidine decarboxylase [Gloeobacter violaceus]|uniref:Histidine decarboxylase n=1 Tax=Gloeobacter violaceus (strain ATCC 29082 / PCC 7421) TaxID=251221 RepID=Q7NIG4_GLOVI|nr:histidine decarboxylase [Gloeobacter violaceus]BAC90160.1 histidine decarboxylase [Gloeobacter violaceus PCC 7421]